MSNDIFMDVRARLEEELHTWSSADVHALVMSSWVEMREASRTLASV